MVAWLAVSVMRIVSALCRAIVGHTNALAATAAAAAAYDDDRIVIVVLFEIDF